MLRQRHPQQPNGKWSTTAATDRSTDVEEEIKTTSTIQRTLFLGLLYFVQGLPYGFQDKLVPVLLAGEGHSPGAVTLVRFLLVPWLLKPAFAPLVDMTLTIAKWIGISLATLAAISLYNAIDVPVSAVTIDNVGQGSTTAPVSRQLIATLFLLNLLSAFQDIAVDAVAVRILATDRQLATGNAGQIVGYKLGALFGSGLLFWTYQFWSGWRGLFATLTAIYLTALAVFTIHQHRMFGPTEIGQTRRQSPPPSPSASSWKTRLPPAPIMAFVFLYKLGESGAMAAYPLFLTRHHQWPTQRVAFWNGTIGMVCSISGSIVAARIFPSRQRGGAVSRLLGQLIMARLLPLALQTLVIAMIQWRLVASTSLVLYLLNIMSLVTLHAVGGLITTVTFTAMMAACRNSSSSSLQATRYTLLSTVEVFGKLILSSISGLMVEWLGFFPSYVIFFALAALPAMVNGV